MRTRSPLFLLTACVVHLAVQAQECDLQIRDGSAARDLGRVLRCLDERLKKLEARADTADVANAVGSQVQNAAVFDAGSFVASVRVATRQEKSIRVAISLRNKTTQPVYVAERWQNIQDQHVLVDQSTGVAATPGRPSIGIMQQGSFITNKAEEYTQVPANAAVDFSMTFDGTAITSNTGNLTLLIYHLDGSATKRLTIPLAVKIRS